MRSGLTFRELGVNELALALIEGLEPANDFYPPIRPFTDCLAQKVAELSRCAQSSAEHRRRIAAILRRIQPSSNEPAVAQALSDIEDGACFLMSGQQVGVCLGPLYTLIKAAALLALRDRLAVLMPQQKFVPLFWASGMDHDFEEISSCYVNDPTEGLRALTVTQPEGSLGNPVGSIELTAQAATAIQAMFDLAARTEHSPRLREALTDAYQPGKTFARAFVELMASLLAHEGLLFFDSQDEEAKELGVPLFVGSVQRQDEEAKIIRQRNERIISLGIEPQVAVLPGETNLFCVHDGLRDKLVRRGDGLATKARGEYFTSAEVVARAEEEPAYTSFGVLLRPVYQQTLFPVAAYLGGTSEAAYWAQMYPLFSFYGLPQPLLVPRPSFTVLSPRQARLLKRYALELTDLLAPQHELLRQLSARAISPTLAHRLRELRDVFDDYAHGLREDAVKLDSSLGGVLDTLDINLRKHLATVEKKMAQATKRKSSLLVGHVHELYSALMPLGKLQERVLTSLGMLNTHGPRLVYAIRDACEFPPSEHRLLVL